jgi:hypothetical protein
MFFLQRHAGGKTAGLGERPAGFKKLAAGFSIGLALLAAGALAAEDIEVVHLNGRIFQVKRDPLTGLPVTIRSKNKPIVTLPGPLTRSRVVQSGALVLEQLAPLLPFTAREIKIRSAEKINGLWYISFWQTAGGFIVYGSSLGFSPDRRGQIFSTGSVLYPAVTVPASIQVDRGRALETAIRSIRDYQRLGYKLLAENIVIYPDRKTKPPRFHQVYAFNFFPPPQALHPASPEAGWGIFVDTQTGKIVERQTLFKPLGCCVPEEGPPLDIGKHYESQIGK